MVHLKDYFNDFEPCKLNSIFDELYQDDWRVSEGNLVDAFGTEWKFRDIDHFVPFSIYTFRIIVASYNIFLGLLEGTPSSEKPSEKIQEKLESANSKIRLLEEQKDNLKKELDIRRKELCDLKISVKSQKSSNTDIPIESTKEYVSLKRRKYVKIE